MLSTTIKKSCSGSVLVVALIFAVITGIALSTYLALASNSLKQANRSFYANSCTNLAEIGLERAIACINQLDNVSSASLAYPTTAVAGSFSGWSLDNTTYDAALSPLTPSATATYSGFNLGAGTTGSVKVFVEHYDAAGTLPPVVAVKARIVLPDGPEIYKYLEVTLRKRSPLGGGTTSLYDTIWSGHPTVGSWDSGDHIAGAPAVPFSVGVMTAEATVASVSGDINLGSGGNVYGYAKTGPDGDITGGSVHGAGTTTNDASRRTNDFNATFPLPDLPTYASANTISSDIKVNTTFPRIGDTFVTETKNGVTKNVYYYVFTSTSQVSLAGSDLLKINSNCVFVMTGQQDIEVLGIGGTAQIQIASGASFNVYTDGDITVAGGGIANSNAEPSTCGFWGTRPVSSDAQEFKIAGNGTLTAIVYAPTADVTLNGGGISGIPAMLGAVVARTITMTGGTELYWDEALRNFTFGNGYGIGKWRELQTQSERAIYSSILD